MQLWSGPHETIIDKLQRNFAWGSSLDGHRITFKGILGKKHQKSLSVEVINI